MECHVIGSSDCGPSYPVDSQLLALPWRDESGRTSMLISSRPPRLGMAGWCHVPL